MTKKKVDKSWRCLRRLFFSFFNYTDQSVQKLEHVLHYRFKDRSLLTHALTHKSHSGPDDRRGLLSNERLEFLGDAVLNCLTTEHLYFRFENKHEGELSKIKSLIVSRKILGEVGTRINLGSFLILGASEKKSGGHNRRSIVSNAFEAVIGAVYLDGGLSKTRKLLNEFLFPYIDEFLKDERHVNYKSKILEYSQRDGFGVPHYSVVNVAGPEHARKFTIEIYINNVLLGEGMGSNKKIAQQRAARKALENYNLDIIRSKNKGVKDDELFSH